MAAVLTPEKESLIRSAYDLGKSAEEASRFLGIGPVAIRTRFRLWDAEEAAPAAGEPSPERVEEFTEEGDKATVKCIVGADGVVTEDDLVRVCKIDLTRWRIARMRFKAYQTGMKIGVREADGKGVPRIVKETPHVVQLFSVSADLERVLPRREMDAVEALFASLARDAPSYAPAPTRRPTNPLLADVCLYDCHFGNLAWEPECGEHDDLRIKADVFAHAIDDIIARLRGYDIEEVVFPIGNDLHHVDTLLRTTTAGTPQDTDGRFAKMVEATYRAVIRAFDRLLGIPTVRKVKALYVPGNHDRLTSYHLCLMLGAWFRNCDRVEVDSTFRTRKYLKHGKCLLGYTHGDHASDSKLKSLATVMAVEQPQAWGETECREWKTGHVHTSKTFETLSSNEFNGVVVRRLRALTGPNAWHFDNLYVGNRRGAEVYLYDAREGYVGHHVANART